MTRAADPAVPFFDVADPAFSVTSAQVRAASSYGMEKGISFTIGT